MTGNEIQRRSDVYEWVDVLPAVGDLATRIAGTEFVPKGLRGKPAGVAAAILTGAELRLGPMKSLASIDIVDGTPTLSAELMRGLVLAAGHRLRLVELTRTRCVMSGQRTGDEEATVMSWSMDDAKAAGLAGKRSWQAHPREMLLARCTTLLCRTMFADVIGGLRSQEEVGDFGEEPAAVTVVEPAEPRRVVQRRARLQAPAVEEPARPAITAAPVEVEDPPLDENPAPQPGPDDEPEPEMISYSQQKMMGALMRDAGITGRNEALAYVSGVIGRDVSSRAELTRAEASRLIDALQEAPVPEEPPLEVDPATGEVIPAELWDGEAS